ncbi:MAG: DUF488 domain-containing protein, partial [Phycisphaerales bacterium]
PISRKPGFSKRRLGERLCAVGISYVHRGDLGTPKPIRDALKADRDYVSFFERMEQLIGSRRQAVEDAYRYVEQRRCCLMCFERLAAQCHRNVVARKIKERDGNGLRIRNL